MKRKISYLIICLICTTSLFAQDGTEAQFRKWALTPPMGWNSWDCFYSSVTEDEVIANAEYMRDHLKEYGWEYVVVDIRWYVSNPSHSGGWYNQDNPNYYLDEYGRYIPAPNRFPSATDGVGFKALADKIHDMGLKFGIHIMRGLPIEAASRKLPVKDGDGITCDMICNNDSACTWLYDNYKVIHSEAGQLYYNSIFELYASWGVDFIKIDDISRPVHTGEIAMIRKAIDECGRPMVLSLSPGKTDLAKGEFVADHSNMWRMTDDLWDRWTDVYAIFTEARNWCEYYRPGCYPDADMIPFGAISYEDNARTDYRQSRLTDYEKQTLMNLWGIVHSPLMYGGNMPENTEYDTWFMTNSDLIEMNKYGVKAREVSNTGREIVWGSINPATGDHYAALFNVAGGDDEWFSTEGALYITETIAYTTTGYAEEMEVEVPENTHLLALVCDEAGDGNSYDHGSWVNVRYVLDDGTELYVDGVKDTLYTNTENAWGHYTYVNVNKNLEGGPLKIDGVTYENGFSCHASSMIVIRLPELTDGRKITKFKALCGIDDTGTTQAGFTSSMRFMVFNFDPTRRENCDAAKALANSGLISRTNRLEGMDLIADISGASKLQLVVTDFADGFAYDRANWVNPVLIDKDGNETSLTTLTPVSYISDFGQLRINRNVENGTLNIGGIEYETGLGMNGACVAVYNLPADKNCVTFKSKVGLDYSVVNDAPANQVNAATVEFLVFGDEIISDNIATVPLALTELGFNEDQECLVTDLWNKEEMGIYKNSEFVTSLSTHQSALYRVTPLNRTESNTLSISAILLDTESAIIEVTIQGATDETSYVQILCDNEVVGVIAADGMTSVIYRATDMSGKHTYQAKYSGTIITANCESEKLTIDFTTGEIVGLEETVLTGNVEDEFVDVYSLTGTKIRSQVHISEAVMNLPKDIYIVGCKKVLVK